LSLYRGLKAFLLKLEVTGKWLIIKGKRGRRSRPLFPPLIAKSSCHFECSEKSRRSLARGFGLRFGGWFACVPCARWLNTAFGCSLLAIGEEKNQLFVSFLPFS